MSDAMQTDTVGKLFDALAKAQAEICGATKSAVNPHLKNRYADLAEVWLACRAALSKHGLCVIQTARSTSTGMGICLVTTLGHQSGEWIRGEMFIPAAKPDAQGLGSALSYARRYSLASMVGVYGEDDDGETAVHGKPVKEEARDLAPRLEESVDLMAQAGRISKLLAAVVTKGELNEVFVNALELKRAGLPAKAFDRLTVLRNEALERIQSSAAE